MEEYAVVDHVFYVVALFAVGLWAIVWLGARGFTPEGVPCSPPWLGRGVVGRVFGSLLILVGAVFVALSLLGLRLLIVRLTA
ncbi:MAG: hypothetical protein ACF8XB_25775 [Planctomycetota bacterium JB042]